MILIIKSPFEKPLSYFFLEKKVTKIQGFIKIWLKANSIPLNKKRPRDGHVSEGTIARRLLFVWPLHSVTFRAPIFRSQLFDVILLTYENIISLTINEL